MLTCRQFADSLGDYLDEALQAAAVAVLEQHMQECPRCRIIWETTRKTMELYKKRQLLPVPIETEKRLLAAIQMKMSSMRGRTVATQGYSENGGHNRSTE